MNPPDRPIPVTQPSLPPLDDFLPYLREIWDSKRLTNGGPMHQQLEAELAQYLGVRHVALFNNATIALIVALKVMDLSGEVVTTPYSFVATAHSLLWNGLKPVFADVESDSLNIDPHRIESAITPQTTGIMPVHCYGRPCDVTAIREIADAHGLKVIYDAAHAFGVRDKNGSVLNHGDLSVLSFHATKVFNTFEGGAIICHDAMTKQRIDRLKNFGIVDETHIDGVGLNGKMNEIQAAFGLLQLKHIGAAITQRRHIAAYYRKLLAPVCGLRIPPVAADVQENGSYFPVLVTDSYPTCRDDLYRKLHANGILARRYFHPLLSELPAYSSFPSANAANLPVATRSAKQALCLPMHADLDDKDVERVVRFLI